jgi:hypothetical protein
MKPMSLTNPSSPGSRLRAFAPFQCLSRMQAFFDATASTFQSMASQYRMGMQSMAQGMRASASAQRMQPRAVLCTAIAFAPVRTASRGPRDRKGDFVF